MTGFSFKNIVLQIIHGVIILASVLLIFIDSDCLYQVRRCNEYLLLILVLFISFIIGVIVDFITDVIESLLLKIRLIKPPTYYLLENGKCMGIHLAHYRKIKKNLCQIASNHSDRGGLDFNYYFLGNKTNLNIQNYLFQVAKNKVFRESNEFQKEQLDSFFVLYIFSRNLTFTLFAVLVTLFINPASCSSTQLFLFIKSGLFILSTISFFTSFRYFLYYSRAMLGASYKAT